MQEHTNGHQNGHGPETLESEPAGALPMLFDGLPPKATEELSKSLDPSLVSHRRGRGGKEFPYLEGNTAIGQANRIFGHGGWGYEVVGEVTSGEVRTVDTKTGEVATVLMYYATVRVCVPGVPARVDVGCHAVADDSPEGHETAYKGAVTDGLKRALRGFGDQFGNGLYGDGDVQQGGIASSLRDSLLQLGKAQGLTEAKLNEAVKKRTGKALGALSAAELSGLVQAMAKKQAAPAAPANSGEAEAAGSSRTKQPAVASPQKFKTDPQAPPPRQ